MALGNYRWEEELPGHPDWLNMDVMEKGVTERDHDEEKGGEYVLNIAAVYTGLCQYVSSLSAGFLQQAPQNTQDWLLMAQGSSTSSYDASTNSSRDIDGKDRTYMTEVLTAPWEALGEMGRPALELMNQRYAEVIVSPSHWPVYARKLISEVLSPDDTSYGSPSSRSIALLLEKAILIWNAAPRYVGLYPHSADPPINITEIIAEYPSSNCSRNTNNPISFVRLARPYHHHHHHNRTLQRTHVAPKLAESFLTSALEVIKALGPIILTALVPLIGRIYQKLVPARYRTGLNKHTKTTNTSKNSGIPALRIMESSDYTIDPEFQEWLDGVQFDFTSYNFDEELGISAASPPPLAGAQAPIPFTDPMLDLTLGLDPAYIVDLTHMPHQIVDVNPAYLTNFSQLPSAYIDFSQGIQYSAVDQFGVPINFADNFYTPPSHSPSSVDSDWLSLLHLSGYSTPSLSEHTDSDNMENPYMGTSPGLSIPTSQNITPQTAGLETPTFTPSCSPVSFTSPPQQLLPRRYSCEYESCGHKEFERPCDLNKHLKTHKKHLQCDFEPNGGCQAKFSTEKDRKRHRETVHEKKRPYVCHICVKEGAEGKEGRFSRKDNLRIHRKKVHGVE